MVVDIGSDVDGVESDSGSYVGETMEEVVCVPRGRAHPPGAVSPLSIDLVMWLNS